MEEKLVVGWPPVKSWRKQLCRRSSAITYVHVHNSGGAGRVSNYVKVKMEGVGITRKIDLTIHRSFRTLAPLLITLFPKCDEENADYRHVSKQGRCFMESAQRLKLVKELTNG